MKKCLKCHKSSYPNQKVARRVMMRIISHDPSTDMFDLHTYKCPHGEWWHVGHKSYYQKALQAQASLTYTSNDSKS